MISPVMHDDGPVSAAVDRSKQKRDGSTSRKKRNQRCHSLFEYLNSATLLLYEAPLSGTLTLVRGRKDEQSKFSYHQDES